MIPTDIDSIDGMELAEVPSTEEKRILIELVYTSVLDEQQREEMIIEINSCLSFILYQQLQYRLEDLQTPIDFLTGYPGQKKINEHLRKAIK